MVNVVTLRTEFRQTEGGSMAGLQAYVAFAESARHGSFATAARELGLSASAVAKSVARLEEDLRTPAVSSNDAPSDSYQRRPGPLRALPAGDRRDRRHARRSGERPRRTVRYAAPGCADDARPIARRAGPGATRTTVSAPLARSELLGPADRRDRGGSRRRDPHRSPAGFVARGLADRPSVARRVRVTGLSGGERDARDTDGTVRAHVPRLPPAIDWSAATLAVSRR